MHLLQEGNVKLAVDIARNYIILIKRYIILHLVYRFVLFSVVGSVQSSKYQTLQVKTLTC